MSEVTETDELAACSQCDGRHYSSGLCKNCYRRLSSKQRTRRHKFKLTAEQDNYLQTRANGRCEHDFFELTEKGVLEIGCFLTRFV